MRSRLLLVAGLLFLLCGPLLAQRPLVPLKNPDRGWHLESIPVIVDSNGVIKNPFFPNTTDMTQILTAAERLVRNSLNNSDHLTLSQSYIYLTNFVGKRISAKALDAIDSVFQSHRKYGAKMVLRFAYDYNVGVTNARYSDIYRHLDQLAPIIRKNAGVIHTWQAGMLGVWGEWHDTRRNDANGAKLYDLLESPDSMRVMIRKMLDIIPEGGAVQVRIPYWRQLFGFEDGLMQRIGLHNDAFTAGAYQFAPGNDYVNGDYTAASQCSPFVPIVGEMPFDGDGDPWKFNGTINVAKALVTLRDHHYTSLDITQNTPLNIRRWTTYNLTADSLNAIGIPFHPEYFKDNGVTVPRTMFQVVRDHFGYNLYFDYDKEVIRHSRGKVSFSIPFHNYGFSRVYNRYKVVAYVLNNADQKVAETTIDANPADWHPFRPGDAPTTRMQHYLQGAIPLPSGLAAGTYKIGFAILPLSPDVAADSAFCIRFANRSNLRYVVTADQKVINVVRSFAYDSTAQYCTTSSDASGQERYFTRLWSEGANQNIDLTNPSKPTKTYFIADQTIRTKQGSGFSLNAVTTDDSKYSRIRAWVDWNQDGTFDNTSEVVFFLGNPNVTNEAIVKNFSQTIGIPANAKVGSTVMRIRFFQAWQTTFEPCGDQIQNTTFDFPVYIDTTTSPSSGNPAYCAASSDGTGGDRYLTSLQTRNALRNLNIASPLVPQSGYRQYTTDYLAVSPGSTFDLFGTSTDPAKASQVRAWADWNGDGIFADDASEILFDLGKHAPTAADSATHNAAIRNFSQPVVVPVSAKLGSTRIRIRYYDAIDAYPGSCGNAAKSSAFDFIVRVEAPEGSAYCIAGSNGEDQERYLTSLSTTGAAHNLVVPAASLVPVNGYQIYRDDALTVAPGTSFNLAGTATPRSQWNRISLWVDWDGNGSFDSTDSLFSLGIQHANDNGPAVLNFNQVINVPLTARPGIIRARIRNHNSWFPVPGPCGDAPNATTFDFLIQVNDAVPYCRPVSPDTGYAGILALASLSTSGAVHNLKTTSPLKPLTSYRRYENDVLVVNAGSTFDLHAVGNDATRYAQMRAWIDWNGDGVFDNGGGEDLFALGNNAASNTNTMVQDFLKSLNVPATARLGYTRLRLRYWDSYTAGPDNACSIHPKGCTFDFPVLILAPGAVTCTPKTENVFASTMYPTAVSTTGAVQNLNMTSALIPQNGYRQYQKEVLTVKAGSTFSLNVTASDATLYAQMRAWIDWNGDGVFDDDGGEELFASGNPHSGTNTSVQSFSKTINVPAAVKSGYTRLRLRYWNSWYSNPGSCNQLNESSTFDFIVLIQPSGTTVCKPETNDTIYAPTLFLTAASTSGAVRNLAMTSVLKPLQGYRQYENEVITVNAGSTFSLRATASDPTRFAQIRGWADWNGDGTFTDGGNELLFSVGALHSDTNTVVRNLLRSITVPATAKQGYTRLRLRYWNSWYTNPGPCNQLDQSTTFDFIVLVLPATTIVCKPETDDTIYAPNISLTSASTSGALHNLNVTSELKPQRGYRYYQNDVIAASAGSTFSLHTVASDVTRYAQMRAWADWNRDGTFTDGSNEELFSLGALHSDTNTVVRNLLRSITVPATANPGYTRLRLRFWNSWLAYPGPCNYLDQSTTFDFTLLVLPSGTTTYSVPVSSYREAAPADITDFTGILYPSPVGQKPLHVQLSQPVSGQADMQLFDVSGHAIAKQEVLLRNGLLEEDVRSLKPGLYFLVLKVNGKSLTFRFVKE